MSPQGSAARLGLWLLGFLCCTGCGRYADFTLPPLAGGDPNLSYTFEPQPAPVLRRGDKWDSHDALNPSVVAAAAPNQGLLNLYSGFDGATWRTLLAVSGDGLSWQMQAAILAPDPQTWEGSYSAANGSALFYNNEFWYWYVAGPKSALRIGLARSPDARTWRKEQAPVLDRGPFESWDEIAVADPYAIRIGPYFYLYYLGQDRADPPRQRIGLARSTDGVHWQKLRTNPLLELGAPGAFDERELGEPAVWSAQGFYWMLYTGMDALQVRRLGLARSTDGVHWKKLPAVFGGSQPWNAKVMCDPTVQMNGAEIRVWFGGGDTVSPDENLDGQIGYGVLRPVSATLAK
jgi:predicted GH43/DUF377 family glycosyl hydrolase